MVSCIPHSQGFPFTIGVEEEYQIIDPETRELSSYVTQILEAGKMQLQERVKPEMLQSTIEVGTNVCHTAEEARRDLANLRSVIFNLAANNGKAIAAAGTHPFSSWQTQVVYPHERYYGVMSEMQEAARRLLIFGMHVHIGMPDLETAVQLQNVARYFLPHILALSTSSPFWMGRNTGFKSYRSAVFSTFPRTGIPDRYDSAAEFNNYVNLLIKTGCIDDGKKIWWDIRPHPHFGTLEVRICDIVTRIDEAIAIAAIIQALFVKLWCLFQGNLTFRVYRRALVQENKWRAMRWGLDGKLIDFGKQAEVPARDLMLELIEFIDDVVDGLGSRALIEGPVQRILTEGTSAERQLRTYEHTGDLKAVVDQLIAETAEGLNVNASALTSQASHS
ncbi:MAG TPA: carboxylate-amine ligase [Herpetosiphonaceae bacterium]|nr:carboxylate-amine ligase [Herpetosiphonaceae bacterium]